MPLQKVVNSFNLFSVSVYGRLALPHQSTRDRAYPSAPILCALPTVESSTLSSFFDTCSILLHCAASFLHSNYPLFSTPTSPVMTVLSPCAHRNDLDMCASSVSSAEISSPPRPDSPRLILADSTAVLRARLRQLQVWGDAAEEEREDQREDQREDPSLIQQPPQLGTTPRDRLADRTRPSSYNLGCDFVPGLSRRKSLFCARPKSDNPDMTRKPSLWAFASRSSMSLSQTSCASIPRRPSFRRRGSFHRYARVSGHATLPDRKEPSSFDSDFDDLSEGLNATKVTETPIEGH